MNDANNMIDDQQFGDHGRRSIINSRVDQAIADGYFTTTGDDSVGDEVLEETARMAYGKWCRTNDRLDIEYDRAEGFCMCCLDKPLTPDSTARIKALAAEYGYELEGDPADRGGYLSIDLYPDHQANSIDPEAEPDFVARLKELLSDPGSFQPNPA